MNSLDAVRAHFQKVSEDEIRAWLDSYDDRKDKDTISVSEYMVATESLVTGPDGSATHILNAISKGLDLLRDASRKEMDDLPKLSPSINILYSFETTTYGTAA